MTENRTNIIIKEIQHWKKNKLLPSHYCDFLLALYTQGDTTNFIEESDEQSDQISKYNVFLISSNFFLLPATFLGLYFIDFSSVQLTFSLIMLLMAIGYYIVLRKKTNINITYSFIVVLCIFLFISLYFIQSWFGVLLLTIIVAGIQCLIWVSLGLYLKNKVLIVLGSIGLLVSLFYAFF
ncbi:hypothetical protein GCM10011351_16880 [Paraliobacillus quinghaiensis]|uniref:Uncharacterized protein n=1 Tax=Paraliobacillus quinghaiensis TaxID=470815 RepID=A0A917TP41_9BACI|nr:hypothetical protein [Paraliobacillus quinghaiensis]GGM31386.1 hypothetical protein GCM10011351_16880 [Paraliobacillus quinghaiensis]